MTELNYDYLCKHCYDDDDVPRIVLTLSRGVHCTECGSCLGGLTEPVNHHRAICAGDTVNFVCSLREHTMRDFTLRSLKDYKTGEVLADIEYDDELVIERDD